MPSHERLELEGCASASVNGIQAWKKLGAASSLHQVQVAHFLDFEDPWQVNTRMLVTPLWVPPSPFQAV